jgi:hypothetical protein
MDGEYHFRARGKKLGFRHEGVRRECMRNEDGTDHSLGFFGMLENEYRQ